MEYRFECENGLDIAGVDARTRNIAYRGFDGYEELVGYDDEMEWTFTVVGHERQLADWLADSCAANMIEAPPGSRHRLYRPGGDWDLPNLLYMIRMRWS